MKKRKAFKTVVILLAVILGIQCLNLLLTYLAESTNISCKGQKFSTAEEAVSAMETEERNDYDVSLDYCPPYTVKYSFDYEDNTIVLYSYCRSYDGEEVSDEYVAKILKHNSDGTLSFDSGFADFRLSEPSEDDVYYYFTNIATKRGAKSISLLYLDKDSTKDIYVDGNKTEKINVVIDDNEFYLCYVISEKDTIFSNIVTPIEKRHKIEMM